MSSDSLENRSQQYGDRRLSPRDVEQLKLETLWVEALEKRKVELPRSNWLKCGARQGSTINFPTPKPPTSPIRVKASFLTCRVPQPGLKSPVNQGAVSGEKIEGHVDVATTHSDSSELNQSSPVPKLELHSTHKVEQETLVQGKKLHLDVRTELYTGRGVPTINPVVYNTEILARSPLNTPSIVNTSHWLVDAQEHSTSLSDMRLPIGSHRAILNSHAKAIANIGGELLKQQANNVGASNDLKTTLELQLGEFRRRSQAYSRKYEYMLQICAQALNKNQETMKLGSTQLPTSMKDIFQVFRDGLASDLSILQTVENELENHKDKLSHQRELARNLEADLTQAKSNYLGIKERYEIQIQAAETLKQIRSNKPSNIHCDEVHRKSRSIFTKLRSNRYCPELDKNETVNDVNEHGNQQLSHSEYAIEWVNDSSGLPNWLSTLHQLTLRLLTKVENGPLKQYSMLAELLQCRKCKVSFPEENVVQYPSEEVACKNCLQHLRQLPVVQRQIHAPNVLLDVACVRVGRLHNDIQTCLQGVHRILAHDCEWLSRLSAELSTSATQSLSLVKNSSNLDTFIKANEKMSNIVSSALGDDEEMLNIRHSADVIPVAVGSLKPFPVV